MKYCKMLMLSVFAAAGLALLPLSAPAAVAVGRVIVASGEIVAVQADNTTRALTRKSDFYAGEILKTGADAHVQIRFIDGALMSLHPATEFRVDAYRFDATEKDNNSSATALIKGGLRTITGLIAKENPGAYKVTTPLATIGVRGTDFELVLDNGLNVAFWGGAGTVTNQAGSILLGKDASFNFAVVTDTRNAPVGLLTAPPPLLPQNSVAPPGKGASDDEVMAHPAGQSGTKTRQADNASGSGETVAAPARATIATSAARDDADASRHDAAKDVEPPHIDGASSRGAAVGALSQDSGAARTNQQRIEVPEAPKASSFGAIAPVSAATPRVEIPEGPKVTSFSPPALPDPVKAGGFEHGVEVRHEFERIEKKEREIEINTLPLKRD